MNPILNFNVEISNLDMTKSTNLFWRWDISNIAAASCLCDQLFEIQSEKNNKSSKRESQYASFVC